MSVNIYENLLKDLKKSNKERKLKLAIKNGFSTVEEYQKYLENSIKNMGTGGTIKKEETTEPVTKEETVGLDYVIAFDSTGSMSSYISSVKKKVIETVENLFKNSPDLQISIVVFGDYCDMESKDKFGKAYQCLPLTSNQNEIINFINNSKNTSGGDSDEFYELVIKKVVEETAWRENAKKAFFLIGDANPHQIGYNYKFMVKNNQIDWKQEAEKASKLGIQIDTLRIQDYSEWYKELSDITGGVCMDFENADKISNVVEGLAYARTNRKAYATAYSMSVSSGDEELIGAFKQMGKLL